MWEIRLNHWHEYSLNNSQNQPENSGRAGKTFLRRGSAELAEVMRRLNLSGKPRKTCLLSARAENLRRREPLPAAGRRGCVSCGRSRNASRRDAETLSRAGRGRVTEKERMEGSEGGKGAFLRCLSHAEGPDLPSAVSTAFRPRCYMLTQFNRNHRRNQNDWR